MSTSRRSFIGGLSAGLLYLAGSQRANAQAVKPAEAKAAKPLPFVPGSWTIAVLPDTQIYTIEDLHITHHFTNQTRWIAQNAKKHNIVYVTHLGDVVHNNRPVQWETARTAMNMLDGVVPYSLLPGNHDYGPDGNTSTRDTLLSTYFPVEKFKSWPTFGGVMEENRIDNSYHLFRAGGRDWIILATEFAPRNETVAWADKILSEHPNRLCIFTTHAYMYFDDTRYDFKNRKEQYWSPHLYSLANSPGGVNDGEEMWQKMVRKDRKSVV